MNKIIDEIINNNRCWIKKGSVASYIPELSKANPDDIGIYISDLNSNIYNSGDYEKKFTIQSISKIISLMLAIHDNGKEYVFSKVGMEPTADAFNSIVNLETKNERKPLNPMINSGAIAVVSMIKGNSKEEVFNRILSFAKKVTCNENLDINKAAYLSEKSTGNRNRSLAYFMKDSNIIENNVEDVLDVYFKQCSIEVNCRDLANIGAMLANDGILPQSGERVIEAEIARIVKTIMVTCGMYDASGEFAVHIGIPAKSGVGGGILAVVPKKMGIGVFSPALDEKGNSIVGIKILEELSNKLDLSIF